MRGSMVPYLPLQCCVLEQDASKLLSILVNSKEAVAPARYEKDVNLND